MVTVVFVRSRFLTGVFESCCGHHTNISYHFWQYVWLHIFSAFYMVCTTLPKTHKKNTHTDTQQRYHDIHKNAQEHHHDQKIWQTKIHKHNNNFRTSKSDKEHVHWVIILWNIFSENCDIHGDFHAVSRDLHFYYDL